MTIQSQTAMNDTYSAIDTAAQRTGTAMKDVENITKEMEGADGTKLQQLQAKLTRLQQTLELLKQIQEKLQKAAEIVNRAPQPQ